MTGWQRAWSWFRTGVLALGVGYLSMQAWTQVGRLLRTQPLGIDFLPMWAAAHEAFIHPHRVYDFAGLTRFEHPLAAQFHGMRPFVYPPTALLALAPFGLAPFTVANAIWTGAGLALILWIMAGQVKSPRLLALLAMALTPASVLVMVAGQVTFVIAALAVAGVLSLKRHPALAGALLGLAGVIKPQALVLLPVALFAVGAWRAIAGAAAAAAMAAVAATLIFGPGAWIAWLSAVPKFEHWVMASPGMERGMITPTALGISLHLDPGAQDVWRLVFAAGAIAMAWSVFRATEDPARRLTALLGGGLFITPYAMHYDAALLAPAAALILTHRPSPLAWLWALAAGALLCCAAIPHWGAAGVTAFVLIVALTPETAFTRRLAIGPLIPPFASPSGAREGR